MCVWVGVGLGVWVCGCVCVCLCVCACVRALSALTSTVACAHGRTHTQKTDTDTWMHHTHKYTYALSHSRMHTNRTYMRIHTHMHTYTWDAKKAIRRNTNSAKPPVRQTHSYIIGLNDKQDGGDQLVIALSAELAEARQQVASMQEQQGFVQELQQQDERLQVSVWVCLRV